MRVAEDVDRNEGGERRRPPASVVVGVISLVVATIWVEALEPAVRPTLTVEMGGFWSLLLCTSLVVGTLLGVRICWTVTQIFAMLGGGLVLGSALDEPSLQSVGGLILLAGGLVCLFLRPTLEYERRRIRVVLV
jgi:hypothetical protein